MAGTQSAGAARGAGDIDDWMGDRFAHLDRIADGAYEAGRRLWSESTRAGGNITAARPGDVTALGMAPKRASTPAPALSPEMQELRRQQAAFKGVTRQLDHDNRWMAAIALAPIAAVGGLEAVPYAIAREIASNPPGQPLQLPGRAPLLKKGDTYYARNGRREDMAFREKVRAKPGWEAQPRVRVDGRLKIPDAKAPVRSTGQQRFLELKPDTPPGRRAGEKALEKYKDLGKTRVVYYRPPK
ncbi:hypothetical protein [Phenylobacterium sp.]|uniref:hypothetical protein n=1 Tax=Phenylobacterium sp. TaxID=1871053 RepID=UPI0025E0CFF3|nr:hypothetical protein [Phenylobacterium sp.]